jgi:uncharacterized protein with LGFP repeats
VLPPEFYGKLKQLGGPDGPLGFPTSDVIADPTNSGQMVNFQNGILAGRETIDLRHCKHHFGPPTTCPKTIYVFEVHGPIFRKYAKLGGTGSFLGYPISDQTPAVNGGQFNDFANGTIYVAANAPEAFEVHGGIRDYYRAAGGPSSVYGYPATDETPSYEAGSYNDFQGGSVLWQPNLGAHGVTGAIWAKYIEARTDPSDDPSQGKPSGRFLTWRLGYPIAEAERLSDGGLLVRFEYGGILWSPQTGAHSMWGAMFTKYWARHQVFAPPPPAGGATSVPPAATEVVPAGGYPTDDYQMARDAGGQGLGYFVPLQHGIATFIGGAPDAYYLDGLEYTTYADKGSFWGCLGFPTSDLTSEYDGKAYVREFQHGELSMMPNYFGTGRTVYGVQCK